VKRFSKRTINLFLGGALIALTALAGTLLAGRSADGGGPAWVEQNIHEYRATLSVSTNPTEQAFLQDKLRRMESIQQNRLQALENAAPKPEDPCALRPTPEPTRDVPRVPGISGVDGAPINPEEFTPVNQWQGEWVGLWVRVYAGSRAYDRQQGEIWVLVDRTGDFGSYPAPTPGGALTITAAEGLVLTLQDESGAVLYFDVASRSYLSTPGELRQTVLPQPTFTPDVGVCPADLVNP
jgi:hypothetical protein